MSNYRMSAQLYCREHPDAVLIDDYHAGDMVCPECGLVVGDRVIDVRAEWRTFSYENDVHDKDNSRVGAAENLLLEDNDMSTMIATGSGSKSMKDEFGRALYRNRRTFTSSQKALRTAYQEVADMADRLNRPKILVDRTIMLFKQVYNFRTLKARSSDAIVAACLYIVCRQDGVSQTFKEICAVSKESKREIGRVYKLIIESLKISMDMVTPGEYMSRFCNNLRVSKVIQNAATYIAEKAVEMDLVHGWSSASLAATAIYMASQASDEKKTAHEIGDITGVQQYTIKRVYESIRPKAMVLFPADFQFSTPVENLPN